VVVVAPAPPATRGEFVGYIATNSPFVPAERANAPGHPSSVMLFAPWATLSVMLFAG
jgi:hypothetical protein